MYCGKITFDVHGTHKCQHVPWAVSARGSRPSVPFGSGCVSCQRCDWQLAAPYRGRSACALLCAQLPLAECVTEPVQLAKQAEPNLTAGFAAVLTSSGRPQQEVLLVQRRGKEKGMEPLLLWEWAVTPAAVLNCSLCRMFCFGIWDCFFLWSDCARLVF